MEDARLGPYQLLEELGSGGMGKVYRAEVQGPVPGLEAGRSVALKVIHAHLLETPGFFKRFLREADLGRTIEHENVVRTYDCDALLHDGVQQNFLVMEYVEGQTLRDLLDELERVPEELCRHIGREVAKGLAAIHEAGVLHRDLKPENVLITPDHVVKVMDLGVARLQDEAIRLSQTGAFLGSIEYAAPEQFRSSAGEPDGRADLHALGVVLYELATGQHPYRDEDVSKVLRNILEVTPRKAGEVNPQLSPFFEEVVHTLTAKARDERFGEASDLSVVLAEGEQSEWWKARAHSLRVETKRPLRRIRIPRETALYGRDDDLAKLHALYEKAEAGGGQVLLIEGEAGIGKTRLVDEFVGRLRQEGKSLNFLFGSYPPGGAATASGAFSTAYREQFGSEELKDTLVSYLPETPILVPAFAALLKAETTPTGTQALTKDSLQTVFVHATRALAAERPTIVLIDDLHFAPEEGRALFSALAMATAGHRVLLLGTMRPGVTEEWTANLTRLDNAESMNLSRLGAKDLSRLLIDAFRSERLATELGLRIAQKSDGNPFFAFEIIRGLREGQFIARQPDGTWIRTKQIEDIQVPSSVLDLVNARVADLSEEERDLLDAASCCGFEFDPLLLAGVADVSEIQALKRLGQIERKHRLVHSAGRHFLFDHHQVQEALYRGLSEPLRERLHAAIAREMELQAGAAETEPAELDGALCVSLCEHYLDGAQGESAVRYLDAALTHLEVGFLNDQAIALADRALEVPDLLRGAQRLKVLLRKGDRLDLLGRREAQAEVLELARRLADASNDQAASALVEQATAAYLFSVGRFEESKVHSQRHLEIARELGDPSSEAQAESQVGIALYRLARFEESMEHLERSRSLSQELEDPQGEIASTSNLGNCLTSLGRDGEARAHYERAIELSKTSGNRQRLASSMGNMGTLLTSLGQYKEATACLEQHVTISREIGYRQGEAIGEVNLGNVYARLSHSEEAMATYERSRRIASEISARYVETIALVNLGAGWLTLGSPGRARDVLERSLSISREIGARHPEGYALWALADAVDEEGDTTGALQFADEALALRRAIGDGGAVVASLSQIGALQGRTGDLDAAREALEEAATLSREQQSEPRLALALALRASFLGEGVEEAIAAVEEASDRGKTMLNCYHLWRATHDVVHLREAKRLLDHAVEHAPDESRETMLQNVRLHREITEAWASHASR